MNESNRFIFMINGVFLATLLFVFAFIVYASLELRGLYADGSFYLLIIIESEQFALIEPSRRSAHFLQQLPTVIALHLGLDNLITLSVLYGMTMSLLPLLFVGACYLVLPAGHKEFIIFPLVHYLAGTQGSSFVAITESPLAAAYFWFVLFFMMFRARRSASRAALLFMILPVMFFHEAMAFLAPVLIVAALCRTLTASATRLKIYFIGVSCYLALSSVVQIVYIVAPRSVENRAGFFSALFSGRWLVSGSYEVNVAAALGIVALLCLVWITVMGQRDATLGGRLSARLGGTGLPLIAFALLTIAAVFATMMLDRLIAPHMAFDARSIAALLSLPLGLLAIASVIHARLRASWMQPANAGIVALLAAGTLGWHVVATQHWSAYVRDFRSILASDQGLIGWDDALMRLDDVERMHNFERMSWAWTNPTLSFLLSPQGEVASVVGNPAPLRWEPFDPADVAALPHGPRFDTKRYRDALAAVGKADHAHASQGPVGAQAP